VTRLSELKVGQHGQVAAVTGDDSIGLRLLEMGVTPGVEVAVTGVAPLGDPIELELRGYRLSVRLREAERVRMEVRIQNDER
jgi:Fe2+ transport system protein FeoA